MRFLPVLLPPPPDSRDGGERGERERTCCVFHPNVDERGFVCADVLATEWSSVCSVSTLLLSVQSILDDPSCERPANVQAAALLLQDRTRYLQRVRMLARATSKARDWDPNT
jgi:ubiquitin-protein ligase